MSNNKKLFIELFEQNAGNISRTCKAVNISRKTYYNWVNEDKDFKREVSEVEEGLIDFAESMLLKNIKSGKETSLIFFLKTKGKGRGYIERSEIVVDEFESLTEEELIRRIKSMDEDFEKI